jgi:hypothetical protein
MRHPIIRRSSPVTDLRVHPAHLQRLTHSTRPSHATAQRRAAQLARDIDAHPHREELLRLVQGQLADLRSDRIVISKHGR